MRTGAAFFIGLLSALILAGCRYEGPATVVPNIEDAPDYVSVRHLEISGVPHPEFMSFHTWRSGSVGPGKSTQARPKQWRYVVPVTSANWQNNQMIPAWVSFSTSKENVSSELQALKRFLSEGTIRGINVDFPSRTIGALRGESAWQTAIKNAEQQFGIRSHPEAPIISWKPQYEK